DDPDAKPRQVIFALLVKVRKDGRLASQERAVGLDAAVADPADDLRGQLGIVAVHGDVIEEEQGLGAGTETVVDRHGDQVDAYRRVPASGEGQLELRADTVGRGDQDRVAIGARKQADLVVESKQPGEPVLPFDDAGRVGPA